MAEKIYIVNAKRIPCCKSKGAKIPPEQGGDGFNRELGKYETVGSVEMLAQGSAEDIDDCVQDIKEYFVSYIRETRIEENPPDPRYTNFNITF